jgi:NAD(P)-dependent dehydrogenase (short-subunit alcohol dehydrogenase family)
VIIVGGASGIGREVVLLAAERGAHIVVADLSLEAAQKVADEAEDYWRQGMRCGYCRSTFASAMRSRLLLNAVAVKAFGGIDMLINTAAMFPSSPDGTISDAQWAHDTRGERDLELPAHG